MLPLADIARAAEVVGFGARSPLITAGFSLHSFRSSSDAVQRSRIDYIPTGGSKLPLDIILIDHNDQRGRRVWMECDHLVESFDRNQIEALLRDTREIAAHFDVR
jgi:hypothetical protein